MCEPPYRLGKSVCLLVVKHVHLYEVRHERAMAGNSLEVAFLQGWWVQQLSILHYTTCVNVQTTQKGALYFCNMVWNCFQMPFLSCRHFNILCKSVHVACVYLGFYALVAIPSSFLAMEIQTHSLTNQI